MQNDDEKNSDHQISLTEQEIKEELLYRLFDEMSIDEAKQFYFEDCHAVLTGQK
ncbi:MAG: hypothetical protein PWP20_1522 [Eubacteriaceae bacterium]|nr:hypothetical protein [Eubacteriaceae bacterium]